MYAHVEWRTNSFGISINKCAYQCIYWLQTWTNAWNVNELTSNDYFFAVEVGGSDIKMYSILRKNSEIDKQTSNREWKRNTILTFTSEKCIRKHIFIITNHIKQLCKLMWYFYRCSRQSAASSKYIYAFAQQVNQQRIYTLCWYRCEGILYRGLMYVCHDSGGYFINVHVNRLCIFIACFLFTILQKLKFSTIYISSASTSFSFSLCVSLTPNTKATINGTFWWSVVLMIRKCEKQWSV